MRLNSSNKFNVWKVCALSLAVALGIAVIWLCFLPQLKALVWHLRHGDRISFQEWTLPVPRGWHAYVFENGLSIDRAPRPFVDEITSFILVGKIKLGTREPFDPQKWKKLLKAEESKEGYRYLSEEVVAAGADTAYCYHFDRPDEPQRILLDCHLSPSHIFINFEGAPQHLQDAYQVIRGTRGSAAQLRSGLAGLTVPSSRPFKLTCGNCGAQEHGGTGTTTVIDPKTEDLHISIPVATPKPKQ